MITHCPECQTELKETHKFCPNCGKNLKDIIVKENNQDIKTEPIFIPRKKMRLKTPLFIILILIVIFIISLVGADFVNIIGVGIFKNTPPTLSIETTLSSEYQPSIVTFFINAQDSDGKIMSYFIDFGDGTTSNLRNPVHTYSAGTYEINVTVTDNEGGTTSKITTIIIKNKSPTVSLSANRTSGKAPLSVSFTCSANDLDGTITNYLWSFHDGQTSNAQNPTHTFTTPGKTYSVSLKVTDNDGSTATDIITITTSPNELPIVTARASPLSGEAPLKVYFTCTASDSDGSIASYSWNFGDGSTSTSQNPSHTFTTIGTYTVTLKVTDDRGGTGTSSLTITVNPHSYQWSFVTSFSGIEDRTTETFSISGTKWKIEWSITSHSNYPYFYFYAYSVTTGRSVAHQSCSVAPYSDTTYVYEGSGTYYFKIGAANLDSWMLSIYQWI